MKSVFNIFRSRNHISSDDKLRVHGHLNRIMEAIGRINVSVAGVSKKNFLNDEELPRLIFEDLFIIKRACSDIIEHHPWFDNSDSGSICKRGLDTWYKSVIGSASMWDSIHSDLPKLATEITYAQILL